MWIWRRRAGPVWLAANQPALERKFRAAVVVVDVPGRRQSLIEVASNGRARLGPLKRKSGGRIVRLPSRWRETDPGQPIKIGRRLIIVRQEQPHRKTLDRSNVLVIPAGAAFGTGDHATTAMSLRLMEKLSLEKNWRLLDLGTGSGIFALAGKRFGATEIQAIDFDPRAIATARANARLNRIRGIDFQVADVRRMKYPRRVDLVTANLFSELLIEILPKLHIADRLILSGLLASQEKELRRALVRGCFELLARRRRGKWIALLVCPAKSGKKRVDGS